MPRLSQALLKYRKHKASGQAVVTLNGCDHDLGQYGTQVSKAQYDRLISEWLPCDWRLQPTNGDAISVVELCAWRLRFAEGYYVKGDDGNGHLSLTRRQRQAAEQETDISGRFWHPCCRRYPIACHEAARSSRMYENLKLIARQRIKRDARSYVVEVFTDEGGCIGAWQCAECGLGGRSPVKHVDAEIAEAWAMRAATVHHSAAHAEPDL